MKLIDIYYKFEKLGTTRSKRRFDLTAYTEAYESLHKPNIEGLVWVYLSDPVNIKAHRRRMPAMRITNREGGHCSAVYLPEPGQPHIGYGDVKNTTDALLIFMHEKSLEIFICKGKKNTVSGLYDLLIDGELDAEIESLRQRAQSFSANHEKPVKTDMDT